MPYVQASPRVRLGYAPPLFSAFAFLVAAGLSLEGSPFCARPDASVGGPRISRASCELPILDPLLVGVYDTTWGVIALDADGTARGRLHRQSGTSAPDSELDIVGRWHVTRCAREAGTTETIHFEWATGSFAAAREWWKPAVLPLVVPPKAPPA